MSFSDFSKKVRAELGVTQRQLAADLHISYVTVNRWEREHSRPNALTLGSFVNYCQAHGLAVPADIAAGESAGASAGRFSISEAARYLRLSRGTIYNLVKEGGLRAVKIGGKWFISRAELELEQRRREGCRRFCGKRWINSEKI
ncbi:MAG: helix-turn-helix domain-containing protein [Gracilibacteraceae bacterium]|jgi:excisionase family DNA binding protein|nr:helix-turn-helix domain-containing protein [Gracilibacteraceae bacterium]